MTVEQTIDIPADRRITLELPAEVPTGRVRFLMQFPLGEPEYRDEREVIRQAAHRAYGAWAENPWENHLEDINAMRDEWEYRNPHLHG